MSAPKPLRGVLSVERITRGVLGAFGAFLICYGALRMYQQQRTALPGLAKWLLGSVLANDLVIAPVVLGIGWLTNRFVPRRFRAYLQGGLITAGMVLAVAAFLIRRQHKGGPKSLALLQQDYLFNTAVLVAIIAGCTIAAYAVSHWRTRRTKVRPPADH
jgi:hypothetical protein